MKRALLFGPSVLLLACAPLVGQQPSGAATRDIRALYQGYMEAFNKKDVGKIMSFYVPGSDLFVFDVTPPRQHVGWADYKKDWEDLFAAFPGPLHQELSDLSVTTGGTLAVSHCVVAGDFTVPHCTRPIGAVPPPLSCDGTVPYVATPTHPSAAEPRHAAR